MPPGPRLVEPVPKPQDLRDAIEATVGRDHGEWMGLREGKEFEGHVKARSRLLDTLGSQAVRLAVLLEAAAGDMGWSDFLYSLPRLHASVFKGALAGPSAKVRLAGRFEVDGVGVTFLDRGCGSAPGEGEAVERPSVRFVLRWSSMPMAAAYLDFVQNCLDPDPVQKLLDPVLATPSRPGIADGAAFELRAAMDRWLLGRARPEHAIKQARSLRIFVEALPSAEGRFSYAETEGGPVEMVEMSVRQIRDGELRVLKLNPVRVNAWHRHRWPHGASNLRRSGVPVVETSPATELLDIDLISDETILAFWCLLVTHDRTEASQVGLLDFRSAARGMLRYRACMKQRKLQKAFANAASLVFEDGSERQVADTSDDDTEEGGHEGLVPGSAWASPLVALMRPPCDEVKWLTQATVDDLVAHVFNKLPGRDQENDEGFDEAEVPVRGSLFGSAIPEATFAQTLLRYVHFGDEQEAAKKKKRDGWVATAPNFPGGYDDLRERFAKVEKALRVLPFATAHALLVRGDTAVLSLLHELEPGFVQEALKHGGKAGPMSLERVLKNVTAYLAVPGNQMAARIKAANDAVNRAGFRAQDEDDGTFDEALRVGSHHLLVLCKEFASVDGWIGKAVPRADFLSDLGRFSRVFEELYGKPPPEASAG